MFQGFNDSTIKYWKKLQENNSKDTFHKEQQLYLEGIKYPLEDLYHDLMDYFLTVDKDLNFRKNSCISSPYNDARFCGNTPMKEYIYVRFRLAKTRKENIVGFYFDASKDCFRYGINIYNLNAHGMEQIRGKLLEDEQKSRKLIRRLEESQTLEVSGEFYKRSYYPDKDAVLRKWLDRKSIHFSHEEPMNQVFFERTLLENMLEAFEQTRDVYLLFKHALR